MRQPVGVAANADRAGAATPFQRHAGGTRQRIAALHRLIERRFRIERRQVQGRFARLALIEIENAVEQAGQTQAFILDDAQEALLLSLVQVRVVEQNVAEGSNSRSRRAHLVAHLAQELVLLAVDLAQPPIGARQFGRRRLDLLRLALQLGGIGADLLGLAGEALQFLDADGFIGDDARHQRARRRGADIGRQPSLDHRNQFVAGGFGAGSALAG